jgi:hypothetical protein
LPDGRRRCIDATSRIRHCNMVNALLSRGSDPGIFIDGRV